MALVEGIPLDRLTQENANAMRKHALHQIMATAQQPPRKRDVCDLIGCTEPGRRDKWISCSVCGRWCHFACANIERPPESGYVCCICNAQYD